MSDTKANLPKAKQTALGLYLTAGEACERWQADSENVMILDVRTHEEYLFVGHPPMAWKIPVMAQSYDWDADKGAFPMQLMADFVDRVKQVASPDATIMALCRSGSRSAFAANLLAQAGFSKVYNIIDGMEGDGNGDSEAVAQSTQPPSGWKNSNCPWTKKLTPERMVLPPKT